MFIRDFAKRSGESYEIKWDVGKVPRPSAKRVVPRTFAGPRLAGGTYDFSKVLGKRPALVTFWASWCEPCIAEAPHLARLARVYGVRGIEFVSVSIDVVTDHEKLRGVVAGMKLPYPVVLDPEGEILKRFSAGGSIPLTLILDAKGDVVYRSGNFQEGDEKRIEQVLRDLLTAR